MGVSSLVSWSITHTHRKMQNGLTNITQTLVRTEMKRKPLQRPTNSHGSCPSHGPPSSQWDYSGCEENCFPGFHQFYHLGLDLWIMQFGVPCFWTVNKWLHYLYVVPFAQHFMQVRFMHGDTHTYSSFISLLCSMPWHEYAAIYLSILLLMDVWLFPDTSFFRVHA